MYFLKKNAKHLNLFLKRWVSAATMTQVSTKGRTSSHTSSFFYILHLLKDSQLTSHLFQKHPRYHPSKLSILVRRIICIYHLISLECSYEGVTANPLLRLPSLAHPAASNNSPNLAPPASPIRSYDIFIPSQNPHDTSEMLTSRTPSRLKYQYALAQEIAKK